MTVFQNVAWRFNYVTPIDLNGSHAAKKAYNTLKMYA